MSSTKDSGGLLRVCRPFADVRFCNTGLMDRKLENDRSGCTTKTARTRRTYQEGSVINPNILESGG
jgi:hypothetical protein